MPLKIDDLQAESAASVNGVPVVVQTRTVSAGAGLSGGGDLSADRTISMPNVGTANTYGSASSVPVITTDAQGRVSGVTPTAISILSSAITDLASSVLATALTGYSVGSNVAVAATDTLLQAIQKLQGQVNARALSTRQVSAGSGLSGGGDLTVDRTISMPNVGTAGTYGSSALIPVVTTDAQGRVSGVTTVTPNHSSLSNLTSDDHLQYLNRSGVRAMTGALDMGSQNINNAAIVTMAKSIANREVVVPTTQALANSTLTLSETSNSVQVFTGSTAGQIVKLPDATTLLNGRFFEIWNDGTATLSIVDNASNPLATLNESGNKQIAYIRLSSNATATGVWEVFYRDKTPSSTSGSTAALDDWLNGQTYGQLGWANTLAGGGGTGVLANQLVQAGHPGTLQLGVGANGARNAQILGDIILGGGTCVIEAAVYIPTLAVGGGNDFKFQFGLGDNTASTTDPANGVFFEYNRVSSLNWRARCASGSTYTNTDSGIAVAAATWYKLKVIINAANTQAQYYIATGTGAYTLIATHTTNLPSTAIDPNFKMVKLNGGNLRVTHIDFFSMSYSFSTAR